MRGSTCIHELPRVLRGNAFGAPRLLPGGLNASQQLDLTGDFPQGNVFREPRKQANYDLSVAHGMNLSEFIAPGKPARKRLADQGGLSRAVSV